MQLPISHFKEAELKVSFKPSINPIKARGRQEAVPLLYEIWDKDLINYQEQFYVLFLNNALEVVCWRCLHTGMMTSSVVDLRMLFGFAFGCGATSMIIAHNHPSGQLIPSEADKALTSNIKEAGAMLGVSLLDHLILAKGLSFSFYEEGLI